MERNVDKRGLIRWSHILCAESSGQDHPARDFFLDHFALGHNARLRAFEAGVDAGEWRDDMDYRVISRQVIAVAEGLENQWLIDP